MRKFLFALAMMAATVAMAESYAYLTVTTNDGDTNYEVSTISKITFDETNMILWSGSNKLGELPLASLEKMSFTGDGMGINTSTVAMKSTIQNGVLRVNAPEGSHIILYNIRGEVVKEVTAASMETELNLSGLRKGVYIVRVGRQAQKLMNK